ncbi:MAG: hypothetical protein FIB07_12475 [Candidatus Methanoperedens sp.]|nr:hypothetical protein [Candidatus Methanoperedens sp.]
MHDENINKIKKIIGLAAGIPDPVERSRKYRTIVGILSQDAVRSNDPEYIEEAMKIAGMVSDDPSKAYVEIIRAISKMNRKDKKTFDDAVKITEKTDNDLDLSVGLSEIVSAFGKYGINKKDEMIYSGSLDLAKRIPMNTYRAMAYRNLSKVMADIDRLKSLELLDRSIGILEKSQGIKTIYQIPAYCDTSAILARLNDNRSYGFFRKAREMAENVTDDFEKSAVLLKILETGVEIGKKSGDKKLPDEAAEISKEITREYYKTLAKNALLNN